MANPTIIDVAKKAGVSKSTVSLVLNGSSSVNKNTAQKVWEAVEALNYVPNRAARSLKSGRSNIIGLVVSDITNPFYSELVRAVAVAARENSFDVVTFDLYENPELLLTHLVRLREYKIEGFLLFTHHQDDAFLEQLQRSRLPAVLLNWGSPTKQISTLVIDYQQGMHDLVSHFQSLGHERLVYVSGFTRDADPTGKTAAFFHACLQANLPTPHFLTSPLALDYDSTNEVVENILTIPDTDRPTAIIAANDLQAMSLIHIFQERGLKIPNDLSIAGIDDIDMAQFVKPKLTTLRQPRRKIGRLAFEILQKAIKKELNEGITESIAVSLKLRDSTARNNK